MNYKGESVGVIFTEHLINVCNFKTSTQCVSLDGTKTRQVEKSGLTYPNIWQRVIGTFVVQDFSESIFRVRNVCFRKQWPASYTFLKVYECL